MGKSYDYGDLIRFTADFTDLAGTLHDPDNIYFQIKTPAGVSTEYEYGVDPELKKSSVGQYYIDIPVTESGYWPHRWYATGTGMASEEDSLYIEPSMFE